MLELIKFGEKLVRFMYEGLGMEGMKIGYWKLNFLENVAVTIDCYHMTIALVKILKKKALQSIIACG